MDTAQSGNSHRHISPQSKKVSTLPRNPCRRMKSTAATGYWLLGTSIVSGCSLRNGNAAKIRTERTPNKKARKALALSREKSSSNRATWLRQRSSASARCGGTNASAAIANKGVCRTVRTAWSASTTQTAISQNARGRRENEKAKIASIIRKKNAAWFQPTPGGFHSSISGRGHRTATTIQRTSANPQGFASSATAQAADTPHKTKSVFGE